MSKSTQTDKHRPGLFSLLIGKILRRKAKAEKQQLMQDINDTIKILQKEI